MTYISIRRTHETSSHSQESGRQTISTESPLSNDLLFGFGYFSSLLLIKVSIYAAADDLAIAAMRHICKMSDSNSRLAEMG